MTPTCRALEICLSWDSGKSHVVGLIVPIVIEQKKVLALAVYQLLCFYYLYI